MQSPPISPLLCKILFYRQLSEHLIWSCQTLTKRFIYFFLYDVKELKWIVWATLKEHYFESLMQLSNPRNHSRMTNWKRDFHFIEAGNKRKTFFISFNDITCILCIINKMRTSVRIIVWKYWSNGFIRFHFFYYLRTLKPNNFEVIKVAAWKLFLLKSWILYTRYTSFYIVCSWSHSCILFRNNLS